MEQILEGVYSRQQIANLLELDIKDTRHFKRNVEDKLSKWGYDYTYTTKQITINRKPQTAQERLNELMIRAFNLDIQIDAFGFACFMYYLSSYEDFQMMPWDERREVLKTDFGVDVSKRTLQNWAKRLFKQDMLVKDKDKKTSWMTFYVNNERVREMIDGNEKLEKIMEEYQQKRKDYFNKYKTNHSVNDAWGLAFEELWKEYKFCIYSCSSLLLNIIGENSKELYELVDTIVEERQISK